MDMRTTIDLDDDLVREAMDLLGERTKRAVIQRSLEELIRQKRRERLRGKLGKLHLELTLSDLERMRQDES
ncbi:MAG TPA: type II toxin-antitoxin system VapB family antitoxin [Candidatus Acetothermia bacterium]|nr:type II toxin-antitoxin system VapB family antitoxin [Candidatus Acetothermia bacterium]